MADIVETENSKVHQPNLALPCAQICCCLSTLLLWNNTVYCHIFMVHPLLIKRNPLT